MTDANSPICGTECPRFDDPNFQELAADCRGLRVRIDEWEFCTDEAGNVVGELAVLACGSRNSEDKLLPTISLQDWADTPLTPDQLKQLYDNGQLPDQMLE